MKKIRLRYAGEISGLREIMVVINVIICILVGFGYIISFMVWEPVPNELYRMSIFFITLTFLIFKID